MKSKKIFLLMIAMVLLLTGCASGGKKGEKIEVQKYKLQETEEGFYVRKGDYYYKPNSQGIESSSKSKFQWFTEPYEKLTPKLETGDTLVYISPTKRPASYQFIRMIDYGWTIGAKFDLENKGTTGTGGDGAVENVISFPGQGAYNETSVIKDFQKSRVPSPKSTKIVRVNNEEVKPAMFTKEGFMLGLTKDGFYEFSYYSGTQFYQDKLKADSHLWIQEEDGLYSTTSYKEEESKYFTISIPETMEPGFYLIPDSGLIEVVSTK